MRPRSGFTLIELLVAFTLLGIVGGSATRAMLGVQRDYVRQREIVRAEEALRAAETTALTLLRLADANPMALTGVAKPKLDPDPLAHGEFDNLRVLGDYNPVNSSTADALEDVQLWVSADTLFVRWQTGGASSPVAYPVRSIRFDYYQADGTAATTALQVETASRVRLTITAVSHTRAVTLTQRQRWVYLRNR